MKEKPIISRKLKSFFKKRINNIKTDINELNLRNTCKSPIIRVNSINPVNYRGALPNIGKVNNRKIIKYNKKILISFGICNYLYFDKLNNSINDVNALSEFFKEKLNFDKIFIYTDENVTKSSVERIITNDLYKNSTENDLIVFSFHGHGYSLDFKNFTEGFLVPYNASRDPTPFELISMNNLSKWFKYIKSKHILLLLDCCFSGLSVLRGLSHSKVKKFNSNNTVELVENREIHNSTIQKHLESSSRIIINAGTNQDMVLDGGWNNNSIFTGAIISSPTFDNNIGSVFNLYYYLLKTISRYASQSPSIGKMEGDMGTDIFLSI